jgi:hypothetical protein
MGGRGRREGEWAELGRKHQVGYGANWAGKENFPRKQVGRKERLGRNRIVLLRKIENCFRIDS